MKNRLSTLVTIALFASTASYAQNKLTGVVYDADKQTALSGVEVHVRGTADGFVTNEDGTFTISTELVQGQVEIASMGYVTKTVSFVFSSENQINLGTIYLSESSESLNEIVVMARGVIDVAEGRKTPIAVSTIKGADIEEKVGARDITGTMVNTPSVYVTSESSGFGDTQMYTRGFDQSNTAFLLNGQPINGMEDGNIYWSNWSGMSDIANAIQIQRGLGSSKLAISSVGGTINFITKATEMNQGGFLKAGLGNDNYFKTTAGYSTGLLENGWGVTALLSHWQGDGYNDMTAGQGQNYFVSIGYKPNQKHNFNFLITGAPQWHDQNYAKPIATVKNDDGTVRTPGYDLFGKKFNNNWGMLNGKAFNDRRNYYHKPVSNLNWDWKIDELSNLSTVIYASWGRGGGTGSAGAFAPVMQDGTGTKDYQSIYDANVLRGESNSVVRASVNNHAWYGLVTNYNRDFNENLSFNVGFDLRSYHGDHFRQLTDLMGGTYFIDNTSTRLRDPNNEIRNTFSTNPWKVLSQFAKNPEDKYGYDYSETINYGGLFAQLEYATDRFSAFFQGAVSNQSHVRWDPYQYTEAEEKSEKVNNVGYNIKGGLSYNIDNKHTFFGNAGVYSRQPYHDNIYLSFGNAVNPFTKNEDIVGLELGYKFVSEFVAVNVNAYKTTWANRVESSVETVSSTDPDYPHLAGQQLFTVNRGVKQDHKGIELDIQAKPLYNLEVKGFASIGDWIYKGSTVTEIRTEDREILETSMRDLDGGKVGNAAQTTFGLGAKYKILPNLSIDADYRYYQDLYANRQEKENLMLPSFQLVDAGISYGLNLTDKNRLSFRVNVNNLFDTEYISQSNTANQLTGAEGETAYKGINTSNQVYFGYGRTWNASVKFTF
ncbi:Outer membrane receptor proteins, mostly Fe transport [Paenimyroides aquimaris]|uniref:Outer membrane receptor proteins, mostly Fe transport n=1 Tax=Paenimyroides marinum TaxID=1159016 RepID=A0A1H6JCH3_9FLAO|nr:TonB-dependent receptor [Paenimyroides aquimaris]SEH60009.1 Outer membrane receptor proteins, mostly Fe transport [Paenimyroides aquimaris]